MVLFNKFLMGFMRFFGVMLSIVGAVLFVQCLGILLDPEAVVKVNGVPTRELVIKIGVVLFTLPFVGIGLLLIFCPVARLEKIFLPGFMREKKKGRTD